MPLYFEVDILISHVSLLESTLQTSKWTFFCNPNLEPVIFQISLSPQNHNEKIPMILSKDRTRKMAPLFSRIGMRQT